MSQSEERSKELQQWMDQEIQELEGLVEQNHKALASRGVFESDEVTTFVCQNILFCFFLMKKLKFILAIYCQGS